MFLFMATGACYENGLYYMHLLVICTLIVLLYLFKLNQVRWRSIHVCGVLIFRVQNINEGPATYKKPDSKHSELYAKSLAVHKFQILRILHSCGNILISPSKNPSL